MDLRSNPSAILFITDTALVVFDLESIIFTTTKLIINSSCQISSSLPSKNIFKSLYSHYLLYEPYKLYELYEPNHSTLRLCSFIFSSSSFMRTTSFWMSWSLALEPIVLISRPISWAINPSLRPGASSFSTVSTKYLQ